MKRYDILWKGILEHIFDDFLKFFFPDDFYLFDLSKGFEFLDQELQELSPQEETVSPKFVDKLVKVYMKNGNERWIFAHIEIQGYNDTHFAERMFRYFYRIKDKYDKSITAIAIFTDDNKNFHPSRYEYEFLGTKNIYTYNTYKILDQEEIALQKDDNPFAIVILTVLTALKNKKVKDDKLAELKLSLIRNLLQRNVSKEKVKKLLYFIKFYVAFENKENRLNFEEQIKVITNDPTIMGIEELILDIREKEGIEKGLKKGREEGREESKRQFIHNLITQLNLPDEQVAGVAEVPVEYVQKIRKEIEEAR